jgi:hypothetical protein
MPDMTDRKIYFHKIDLKKDDEPVSPLNVFNLIEGMPFTEQGRYLEINDERMWTMYIDHATFPIKGKIGTIRKKGLPLVERRGETSPLDIPSDAGLYEPMHFVIYENGVGGFEYNFYAPRPSSLKHYIKSKLDSSVDEIDMKPLMRRDVLEMLRNVDDIRCLTMSVHRDMGRYMKELDDNLPDAFNSIKEFSDAEEIELTLKSKKYSRKSITLPSIKKFAKWIRKEEVRTGVNKLQINAMDGSTGKVTKFDLLQEYLLSTKQVVKQDDALRSVNSTAMYNAIEEAYSELKDEINQIISTRR